MKLFLTNLSEKLEELKKDNIMEFKLFNTLEPNLFQLTTKYFGRKDRKLLTTFDIRDFDGGKKRKWIISLQTKVNINSFPYPDDFKLTEDDILCFRKKPKNELIESKDNHIPPELECLPDLETYIKYYMEKQRASFSKDSNMLYLRKIFETYEASTSDCPHLTKKQRRNKIDDMKRVLGQCQIDEKEYMGIITSLDQELITQQGFYYHRLGEEKSFNEFSEKDLIQIRLQIIILIEVFHKFLEKIQLKMKQSTIFISLIQKTKAGDDTDRIIADYNEWIKEFHEIHSMNNMIDEARSKIYIDQKPSTRTILRWVNDFKKNNYQGLTLNCRGHHKRNDLLTDLQYGDYSLTTQLKLFIRIEKEITIAKCVEWVKSQIKDRFPVDHPLYNFIPSKTLMHKWLHRIGARYTIKKKCYKYTGSEWIFITGVVRSKRSTGEEIAGPTSTVDSSSSGSM